MIRLTLSLALAFFFSARALFAQESVWIQVEAQPSLVDAEERVRDYAQSFADVNGFSLGSGWYAIALGPFTRPDAQSQLQRLRAEGRIPSDSFIAFASSFRQQFWPVGAQLEAATPVSPASTETSDTTTASDTAAQTPAEPAPEPDETPREARASEAQLNRSEREALQVALQWAGFYTAAIDGAFGRGTRASMAAWQEANGFEETGVLTTRQRALLLQQYNAVLDGMDLQIITDATTGIEMLIPQGVVRFDAYEAPFARYEPQGALPARVMQISQPGNQTTLFGLYDILQTLEIVPLDGPRERRRDGFTIIGENAKIVSHTEVTLRGNEIKGFILIWPANDEERRTRVLAEMQESFRRIDGVLPAGTGVDEAAQSVDLVAGLRVRTPIRSRSGFFIDRTGRVLTTSAAVDGCGSITLDGEYKAQVASVDASLGVALLAPEADLSPMAIAELATAAPRLQAEVAVAGYSFEGILGAPTMTFGTLADVKGLGGETYLDRLAMNALPGDEGGPVVDSTGAVVGLLQPREMAGRQLPDDVAFATDADALRAVVNGAGLAPRAASSAGTMAPEDLTRMATAMTVLVSCWE
ncbi:trypsin-like peptidase domain-containing protein [Primorskyibacter sp. S187A]|uniref:trypsin-like peptidase domain-containing protein n=1 Tax=Primorskyibacter sp. S187A TaxID=3415130 RepID=UPI003C7CCBA5